MRFLLALAFCILSAPTVAQTFPSKPLRIVVRAPPDGQTVLLAASGLRAIKTLRPDANVDPWRDFAWISQVANYQLVLVAHPSLPVKSIKELIALARSRPGKLSYGSSGV